MDKLTVVYADNGRRITEATPGDFMYSPTHEGPCCLDGSRAISPTHRAARYEWCWIRCHECGFTRKQITRILSDFSGVDLERLRNTFKAMFENRGKR